MLCPQKFLPPLVAVHFHGGQVSAPRNIQPCLEKCVTERLVFATRPLRQFRNSLPAPNAVLARRFQLVSAEDCCSKPLRILFLATLLIRQCCRTLTFQRRLA